MIRCLLALLFLVLPVYALDDAPRLARIIDSGGDRVPEETAIPAYPREARRDRIEGEVQVCFEVTRSGRTRSVAVRSSTHRIFEKPAIKAVRSSRFRPLEDHEPTPPAKLCRTFVFALEPVEQAVEQ